ncbi:MAG: hypothetical protein JWO38_1472 [Gemmataceae bacterium]|nr:hypothetical protein [Gemmataceae bacterium]
MTADDFTTPVAGLVADAVTELKDKHFSDIIDDAGHQYVDLVMGGGGVLGIALVGYTYALERVGVRFLRVGGTSAGSINALALAGLDTMGNAKSERLVEQLANLDVWSFVDGPAAARSLVKDFLHQSGLFWKAIDVAREYSQFSADLGLNPGDKFREWLSGVLKSAGISTAKDLHGRMQVIPAGLRTRAGTPLSAADADAHLAVVATDISTETKAVLPRMAELYWADPDAVDPAVFVRASMSIPFFYMPLRVAGVPQGSAAQARWTTLVGNDRFPPDECAFVDGGVLSNFPINVFHDPTKVPEAPTFGARLGGEAPPVAHFDRLVQLTMAVFNSARHALDSDFLDHNPDFRELICTIDTGSQSWLNFDLTPADKIALFGAGVESAIDFLRKFDWTKYKQIRQDLADAHKTAGTPSGGGNSTPAPAHVGGTP